MAALARWAAREEDFNLASWDGEGYLTIIVAREPRPPRGPRVTGADREGQLALLPLSRFPAMVN